MERIKLRSARAWRRPAAPRYMMAVQSIRGCAAQSESSESLRRWQKRFLCMTSIARRSSWSLCPYSFLWSCSCTCMLGQLLPSSPYKVCALFRLGPNCSGRRIKPRWPMGTWGYPRHASTTRLFRYRRHRLLSHVHRMFSLFYRLQMDEVSYAQPECDIHNGSEWRRAQGKL